jgi:hypothetical protein
MADDDGIIGESKVHLNKGDRVEVLSGPLKGFDGWITKLNRRKSRVAIDVLLGLERREIWLGAEFVDTTDDEQLLISLREAGDSMREVYNSG